MSDIETVKSILKENGLRITQSRLAIAMVLIRNSDRPLTSEEIFNKIQVSKVLNCNQVSVYRTLIAFEELRLVQKSNFQGDASRYIMSIRNKKYDCSHDHDHEHFFKCNSCNKIESFGGCLVSKKEKELESAGYRNLEHHLEITGLCPKCAKA